MPVEQVKAYELTIVDVVDVENCVVLEEVLVTKDELWIVKPEPGAIVELVTTAGELGTVRRGSSSNAGRSDLGSRRCGDGRHVLSRCA